MYTASTHIPKVDMAAASQDNNQVLTSAQSDSTSKWGLNEQDFNLLAKRSILKELPDRHPTIEKRWHQDPLRPGSTKVTIVATHPSKNVPVTTQGSHSYPAVGINQQGAVQYPEVVFCHVRRGPNEHVDTGLEASPHLTTIQLEG